MSTEIIHVSDEVGLIAKLRIPLDGKRATMLAALVIQHPEHALTIEPPFLVMRHPEPPKHPSGADWPDWGEPK